MGHPSSIGYGHQPYGFSRGGSPFQRGGSYPYPMGAGYGIGDWAEEVTWRIIPEFYRDEDGNEGVVPEPLRGFIDSIKPLLNELIRNWRDVGSVWDALRVRLSHLPKLAASVGVVLDTTKNERLQRSEVRNQAFLILNKGTDQGYSILAAFEELTVEITPLWAADKIPGAALSPTPPATFVPHFDDIPSDTIPLDAEFIDQFALWPRTLHFDTVCRTHKLRLVFSPIDNPTQDFDPDVAGRIANRLLRFTPLHVEIDTIAFDGLRGASPAWISSVVAENSAVGMWVDSAVGELRATSPPWIESVVGIPVP